MISQLNLTACCFSSFLIHFNFLAALKSLEIDDFDVVFLQNLADCQFRVQNEFLVNQTLLLVLHLIWLIFFSISDLFRATANNVLADFSVNFANLLGLFAVAVKCSETSILKETC